MKLILPLIGLFLLLSPSVTTAQSVAAQKKPLKVFVLVGQSNMQGHARTQTLQHIGMREHTMPLYELLTENDGSPAVHKDVWINSISTGTVKKGNLTAGYGASDDKIGPELAFGATIQQLYGEPILIIKSAWGGKSLHTDFRPPSAGKFVFSKQQLDRFNEKKRNVDEILAEKEKATGKYFRLMIEHVRETLDDIKSTYPAYDAKLGYELSGMVWFQGWNDMVDSGAYPKRGEPGGYQSYSDLLTLFIRDIRKELKTPKLPFVIGVMGVGGPTAQYSQDKKRHLKTHQNFRDAMAAPAKLPEFRGNVAIVLTENYWDQQLGELQARKGKVNGKLRKARNKDKNIDRKAEKALRETLLKAEFLATELREMEMGISNQEYHYLGSATILSQTGKGFAEAMHKLMKVPKR